MTRFSLAPGFCKVFYTGDGKPHTMTVPVFFEGAPTVGIVPTLINKGLASVEGDVAVPLLLSKIMDCLHTADAVTSYEFWYKANVDSDPVFISSSIVAGGNGTSSAPAVAMSEVVLSFRTHSGNLAKMYLMESVAGGIGKLNPPAYNGATYLAALANFLVGSTSIMTGRDGAFLETPIRASVKYSDALYKKYFG